MPRDFAIAWGSKLAVQLGAAFAQGYIYLYLATLPAARGEATALLTLVAVRQGALQQTLGDLFLLCAGLALVAGLSILRIRSVR